MSVPTYEGKLQSTFISYQVQWYGKALVFSHCSVRIFYLKTASCKKAEVGKEMNFLVSIRCSEICHGFLLLHTDTYGFWLWYLNGRET